MEKFTTAALKLLLEADYNDIGEGFGYTIEDAPAPANTDANSNKEVGSSDADASNGNKSFSEAFIDFLIDNSWTIQEISAFIDALIKESEQLRDKWSGAVQKPIQEALALLDGVDPAEAAKMLLEVLTVFFNAMRASVKDGEAIREAQATLNEAKQLLEQTPTVDVFNAELQKMLKANRSLELANNGPLQIENGQSGGPLAVRGSTQPVATKEQMTALVSKFETSLATMSALIRHAITVVAKPNDAEAKEDLADDLKNPAAAAEPAPEPEMKDESGEYLIWPANPYLLTDTTRANIASAEALIKSKRVPMNNVYVFVPRKGADGDFGASSIKEYLCSKLGLSSGLASKDYKIITQIETFISNSKPQNKKEHKDKRRFQFESARERMRNKLFEEEGTDTINASSSGRINRTNAEGDTVASNGSLSNNNSNLDNAIIIHCTPRIKREFDSKAELFKKAGFNLITDSSGFKDDNESLKNGQQIFKDILTFKTGTKAFSKSKTDAEQAIASAKKQESAAVSGKHLYEKSTPEAWSWENIKANNGAKDFIGYMMNDVTSIKNGMDDGGNPNKLVGVLKQSFTELSKSWSAAAGDAADLTLESFGLGWLGPAFKAATEKYRKSPEQYQGIEAFVRSDYSNSLFNAAESPTEYIEARGDK